MKSFLIALVLSLSTAAHAAEATPNFIVHILGYVRKDYPVAVEKGKVISAPEYQEQIDFVTAALQTAEALPQLKADSATVSGLKKLNALVQAKGSKEDIAATTLEVERRVIELTGMEVAPLHWPNRLHGKALFQQNCTSCHGVNGQGDGPAGTNLDPKPTNFHDVAMDDTSSFQLFNTIRLGIPGTGMAAFSTFSDKEVWDMAFYVASLRHEAAGAQMPKAPPAGVTLAQAAKLPDSELRKLIGAKVGELRMHSAAEESANASITIARNKLNEAVEQLRANNREAAQQLAVMAYLEGVEPIEPRLRARNADLVVLVEEKMADVRSAITAGHDAESVKGRVMAAHEALGQAESALAQKELSPALTFWIAAGIFTREAFEAILILITLLGVIRSIGSRKAAYFVHAGWTLAVSVGVAAWFFSGWVMAISGAQREMLEGSIALLAVIVLLYLGFWLHQRSEIGKWRSFIGDMVNTAVTNDKLIILGGVSFMAVFREAFEVVLFLRALLLEAGPSQQVAVAGGVLSSFVLVVILAMAMVRYSARIPVRQLFAISSFVMVGLALILIGKAARSFQEMGWLTITRFPVDIRFELLGLYPTYESLLPQFTVVAASLVVWAWGRRGGRLRQQPA